MELDSSSSTPPTFSRPVSSQSPLSIPPAKPPQSLPRDEYHLISRPSLFSIDSTNYPAPFLSDPPSSGSGSPGRATNPLHSPIAARAKTPEAPSTTSDSRKYPPCIKIPPRSSSHLLPVFPLPQSKVAEAEEKMTSPSEPVHRTTTTKRNVDPSNLSVSSVFVSFNDCQKKETSRLTPLDKTSQNLPSQKV